MNYRDLLFGPKSGSRKRLEKAWSQGGLGGVLRVVAGYLLWRSLGSPQPDYNPPSADDWVEAYDGLRPESWETNQEIGFSILCPVYNTPPTLLGECVDSVLAQTHRNWELILVDDASTSAATRAALEAERERDQRIRVVTLTDNMGIAEATNAGASAAVNDYLVFMDHDDRLASVALEWLSTCCPRADLVYTDEDKIDESSNRTSAFFKPSWSPRLLLGLNYINHLTCIRRSLLDKVGGFSPGTDGIQDHDLLLRLAELEPTVAHVPLIGYHWRAWSESVAGNPGSKVDVESLGVDMLQRALDRRGWNARAALGDGAPFNYRVLFEPSDTSPLVKVVIPTRDRLSLLRRAVDGVLTRTDGVDVHVVIVDNGSRKANTLAYLAALQRDHENVTVFRVDDAFNFSRLCNLGATVGPDAPYLLFLNNDVEVLHRNWLLQMVGWLREDPGVVGVGSKLLYPDGTIQHGGVILGFGGIAGHYAAREPNQPSLGNLHDQAREVGCLTAACLLVRMRDFDAVGGFNEELQLDFQDVDFCLRLRTELGGELVYDPTYPMTHLESATRGSEGAGSGYTIARMRFLWGELLAGDDPYYSPHLSLSYYDFSRRDIPEGLDERRDRVGVRWSATGHAGGDLDG